MCCIVPYFTLDLCCDWQERVDRGEKNTALKPEPASCI